jgi:hypothetical protein
MSVLYKQAAETKIFSIEFSNQLAAGDSLTSLTSVLDSAAVLTITSKAISGTKVNATYAGGVNDTTYTITAIVVTTDGETLELDVYLRIRAESTTRDLTSYFNLLERIGDYLFGIRNGYTGDQVSDIEQCMQDGLGKIHAAHDWSFFKPIKDITTTAPYATGTVAIASGVVTGTGTTFPSAWAAAGVLKVSGSYYSVNTYDSATQLTLDDLTVTVSAGATFSLGRPEIPLDASFEAVAGVGKLTYYADQNEVYPSVWPKHDAALRVRQTSNPYYDRPEIYSIRTVEFDPDVGSRKVLAFHPTPDAAYTLQVPMILRQTMIDERDIYPVGGEMLSQVIIEACLASAEHNFEERKHVHTDNFDELLPLAIAMDQDRSSPASLGRDAPLGEGRYGIYDEYTSREQRIGAISLGGVNQ